jgi:outer membrane receptor protein involved in Fe transport
VSAGAFAQHISQILPGRLSVRSGLRFGHFTFRTRAAPAFDVDAERVPTGAMTFHTGAVVTLTKGLNATFTASRGFRAANAADLGAIGVTGGGFEITPGQAGTLGARIGTNDGAAAVATSQTVGALRPESLYAIEAGLKLRTARLDAAITLFDLELRDAIQRRTAIFPTPVVGQVIAGHVIERQDDAGRAFVATDARPIVTRVNVDRARIRGWEMSVTARLASQWRAGAYASTANGRELDTDLPLQRMPPPLGGAHVRFQSIGGRYWIEATTQFAWSQVRLSPGDLSDARVGALRSRASIAAFFGGTASDLGLVRDGILIATGESLADVQRRVLGQAEAAPLYSESSGFVVVGARAGFSVGPTTEITVIGENLTDRNYRWHGSGVDGPGANVQVRLRYRF